MNTHALGRVVFGRSKFICDRLSPEVANKFAPTAHPRARGLRRAFTLAEVLAALLFMAIVIPVAMEAVSVASRAGILGQRKASAIRIAERVLDEMVVTNQAASGASSGTITEGDVSYPWLMTSTAWTEDSMTVVTVKVTFEVQGNKYDVSASTLFDATAAPSSDITAPATQ